jgi:protein involved in polysaccharide export with SLBB domain
MFMALVLSMACGALAQSIGSPAPADKPAAPAAPSETGRQASRLYVIKPNDMIEVRVYQEEDLTVKARVARDGSVTLPLLGAVKVGSNTVEQAIGLIRDLLAKDFLVNPQVSLSITEYAKRRFTVLGQVSRPGTYEMPSDESTSLLQAIATAGGYTRIGNPRKITVQRMVGEEKKVFKIDAEAMSKEKGGSKPFEIQPDDVIMVGEKWI